MGKKAIVLLAPGVEEMEAVITIDTLRRAEVEVVVAGVCGGGSVACSRGVNIMPDCDLADGIKQGPFDAVVLPGGMQQAQTLCKLETVKEILQNQEKCERIVGAICAAPMALKEHGIYHGKKLTCYPALKDKINFNAHTYMEARVVHDGNLITSQGPATALDFALKLVEALCSGQKREAVARDMLVA